MYTLSERELYKKDNIGDVDFSSKFTIFEKITHTKKKTHFLALSFWNRLEKNKILKVAKLLSKCYINLKHPFGCSIVFSHFSKFLPIFKVSSKISISHKFFKFLTLFGMKLKKKNEKTNATSKLMF